MGFTITSEFTTPHGVALSNVYVTIKGNFLKIIKTTEPVYDEDGNITGTANKWNLYSKYYIFKQTDYAQITPLVCNTHVVRLDALPVNSVWESYYDNLKTNKFAGHSFTDDV